MKLLVPLDESLGSQQVLTIVEKLAKSTDWNVTLLTVCRLGNVQRSTQPDMAVGTLDVGGLVGPDFTFESRRREVGGETKAQALDATEAEARTYLSTLAEPLEQEGISVYIKVTLADDVAKAIIELASDDGFDLIAMSTHGRGGLDQLLHGSVARSVLQAGVAPVVLVRPQEWRKPGE